jgi:hypothetical protein
MDIFDVFGPALYASRRVVCLVRGHDLIMQFDHRRLSLRCVSCGYRTPGWVVGEPPATRASIRVDVSPPWPAKDQRAA